MASAPAVKKRPRKADESLTSLPNIGRVSAAHLNKIGITTKKQFLSRDPYQVFDELLEKVDPTLCRCALASLVGAKLGKPWHEITKQTAVQYQRRRPGHRWGKC